MSAWFIVPSVCDWCDWTSEERSTEPLVCSDVIRLEDTWPDGTWLRDTWLGDPNEQKRWTNLSH